MTVRRGRYELHEVIGEGGMATVHLGMLSAKGGFRRLVAIKRLHPELARQNDLARTLVEEAKLASRVMHVNVVPVLDVLEESGETWLVMDHVAGETLARLIERAVQRGEAIPLPIAVAIVAGVLRGLHAAHEATAPSGEPLTLVHRDVSPQNVIVGADGIARLLDFGIARAAGRSQVTRPGYVRGKLAYMAPEQLRADPLSRRSDLYAAAVVLWELITGRALFAADSPAAVEALVLGGTITPPSQLVEGVRPCLDRVVLRALARDATLRFECAGAMADALEGCVAPARPAEVAAWVDELAHNALVARAELVAQVERRTPEPEVAPALPQPTPSASEPGVARPRDRRSRSLLGLLVFALLAAAVTSLLVLRARPPDSTARASPAPAESAHTSEPSASLLAPATARAVPSSAPSIVVLPERKMVRAPSPPRPTASASRIPDSCNPPYVLDDEGHRIFKRECL